MEQGAVAIGIVDNDPLALQALRVAVESSDARFRVSWMTDSATVALRRCLTAADSPRVLLVDMAMEEMSGAELVAGIRRRNSTSGIVCISSYTLETYADVARLAGAQALVAKHDVAAWKRAIMAASNGIALREERYCRGMEDVADAYRRLRDTPGGAGLFASPNLSARETNTLHLYAEGLTRPQVAECLGVKASTVATFERRALAKLGVGNRAQAIASCVRAHMW